MRIVSIVGARPQFVKSAVVSRAFKEAGIEEFLLHTGQHYDECLSGVFFREMGMREPDVNLGVGSDRPGRQTARMLDGIEDVLLRVSPDHVVVFGDTNSTLAGAMAALKTGVSLVHIEAGLRSRNRSMPEEHNRVLTDHASDLLFCPTITAVENLKREGISRGVYRVGDVMCDAVRLFADKGGARPGASGLLGLKSGAYVLVTLHRPCNTDSAERLRAIVAALSGFCEPVVFPMHPRTRQAMARFGLEEPLAPVRVIEPLGYLDMLDLEKKARVIVTDSGGVQKEAYFMGVPCITVRSETEWPETVESGWNVLTDADTNTIQERLRAVTVPAERGKAFGDGFASQRIAEVLIAGRSV